MNTVMTQTRPSVFVKSNEEGVDSVKKGKGLYAFFMESTSIEYQVERNCDLQQVGAPLDSKGYGIGLPVSEYTQSVRVVLLYCCTVVLLHCCAIVLSHYDTRGMTVCIVLQTHNTALW
jgi:hypothetical protein